MSCADSNSAAIPTPCVDTQGDGRWMSLHNRFVSDSKDKEPDVLFVGDSLVQLLQQFEPKMVRMMGPGRGAGQGTPRMGCQIITRRTGLCTETLKVWRDLFSPLHALNFGVGGDATQNVLWRLSNGELDHISPKVVVLWVGTNNHGHTPEQICEGIIAIARLISNKLLHAHTLILGLLPRGENPNTLRDRNAKVNELLQQAVPSLPRASYLSVDRGFVQPNGKISHQDMYDYLHLTPQGYHNVCKPVHDAITHLLEKRGEN